MGFTQKSTNQYFATDGVFGFNDGTYDYLTGGWAGGSTTYNYFYRSSDDGATFSAQTAFTFNAHTFQSCVANNVAYIVGGDTYNKTVGGDWKRSSHKFESGAWSQIAANPGIADRCLGALVYHNDDFYLIGGQYNLTVASAYHTVLRSTDGLTTFTEVLSDTRTQGFFGGLLWGSVVSYKGLLWKIGGGVYTDTPYWCRKYDTNIFSSPDGVSWTWRGRFKGAGRNYPQCLVFNDKIYVFNGFNPLTHANVQSPGNMSDYWTLELLSSGKIVQTYKGTTDWGTRHALACWLGNGGIMMFGGSGGVGGTPTRECWLYTDN